MKLCVVGAGVIGLHVANYLSQRLGGNKITLISDDFDNSTSYVAAGLFKPNSFFTEDDDLARKIIVDSWKFYEQLINTDPKKNGVKYLNMKIFSSKKFHPLAQIFILRDLCKNFKVMNKSEMADYPGSWVQCLTCITLLIDPIYHMAWLKSELKSRGVSFVLRHVDELQSLFAEWDIVVNCTGLGATMLTSDYKLTSIRGQVYKIHMPDELDTALIFDSDTYIIPGIDFVTLGGCRQFGSFKTAVDQVDSDSIWSRCLALDKRLAYFKIIKQEVGLRPYRSPVRLELERYSDDKMVMHCYGHGADGFSTAPGTASYVYDVISKLL